MTTSLSEAEVEETQEEPKKRGRPPKEKKAEVICDHKDHLKKYGFDFKWLDKLTDEYGFEKYEYLHKFRAFRCYKDGMHVDWIDINTLSLLNGGRRLEPILLRHQPVPPRRAIIEYPWRNL